MRRSIYSAFSPRLALTLALSMMFLAGCLIKPIHTAVLDERVVCQAFPNITYAQGEVYEAETAENKFDTLATIGEIKEFNAAQDALCNKYGL